MSVTVSHLPEFPTLQKFLYIEAWIFKLAAAPSYVPGLDCQRNVWQTTDTSSRSVSRQSEGNNQCVPLVLSVSRPEHFNFFWFCMITKMWERKIYRVILTI